MWPATLYVKNMPLLRRWEGWREAERVKQRRSEREGRPKGERNEGAKGGKSEGWQEVEGRKWRRVNLSSSLRNRATCEERVDVWGDEGIFLHFPRKLSTPRCTAFQQWIFPKLQRTVSSCLVSLVPKNLCVWEILGLLLDAKEMVCEVKGTLGLTLADPTKTNIPACRIEMRESWLDFNSNLFSRVFEANPELMLKISDFVAEYRLKSKGTLWFGQQLTGPENEIKFWKTVALCSNDAIEGVEELKPVRMPKVFLLQHTPKPNMLSLSTRICNRAALRTSVRTFCSEAPKTNLFIGNLSWDATRKDLSDLFSEYGKLTSVRLMVDRETGRSRGFGFVNFESAESASAASEALVCIFLLLDLCALERKRVPRKSPQSCLCQRT